MKDDDTGALCDALLTSQELLSTLLDHMQHRDWRCHDCASWRVMIDAAMRKNSDALAVLYPAGKVSGK